MTRQTAKTRAIDRLRAMIFDGTLPPGSTALEPELADRLGLSRTPIREACLHLAAQGLIEVIPRHGIRVVTLSPKDMDEIYEILTDLEARAAATAARARPDATRLAPLRAAIDQMDAALAADNRSAWADHDEAFHSALIALGGNSRTAQIAAGFNDQTRRARQMTLHLRPAPTASNDDHRAVLEAIAAGDADTAYTRHVAHRQAARQMIVKLLQDLDTP